MSESCKYPLDVEALSKHMQSRELAERLAALFAQASPAVRDALERGWFDPPSDFFDVPSTTNSYRLSKLMVGWQAPCAVVTCEVAPMPLAVAELDAFDAALREFAASLEEPADLVELIGAMDNAGFGIAAAPVVEHAHKRLRTMSTTAALLFLGLDADQHCDDWRVWETPDDAKDEDSAEARNRRLMRKQAIVTGNDIVRVRAAETVN